MGNGSLLSVMWALALSGDIVEVIAISVNSFGVGPTGPTGSGPTGPTGTSGPTGPTGGGGSGNGTGGNIFLADYFGGF